MNANWLPILIPALVFAAVALAVMAVAPMFTGRVDLKARLSSNPPDRARAAASPGAVSLRARQGESLWERLVAEVESRGLTLDDDKAGIVAEKLRAAGYHQPYAVRVFGLIRMGLTLLLPILTYLVTLIAGVSLSGGGLYLLASASALCGLYLPNIYIDKRAEANRAELLNGFPDALDLLLVCVQAGLGVDSCFARVGQEIIELHPRLARLFAGVSLELRAGRSRADALKNMASQSGVEEIRAFATLIVQSDKLGTSIGQALKIYAGEMREARRMRAEEKAHRLPVLLSVPLVVFLLPTMVGVLALPASITLREAMFSG